MGKTRTGPKSRGRAGKKGWPSKTRSMPWRSGSSRPTLALSGIKAGLRAPTSVHRFTRWSSTVNCGLTSTVGGVYTMNASNQDAGTSTPVAFGTPTANTGGAGGNQGYQVGAGMQFLLTDVPSYTDFTSLFDHYTIEQVDVEIDCLLNSAAGASSTVTSGINTALMPSVTYVPDFDDSSPPTTGASISEYQRAKTWTFRGSGKPLTFSIKPRTAVQIFRGVTSAYAAGAENTAINLAYNDVPHYGVKLWFDNVTSDIDQTFRVRLKYHLKFQDPK